MLKYAAGRLLQAVIAIFGVLTIVFIVMHLSGDPTLLLVPQGASTEMINELRHQLGFDQPLWVQYLQYLEGLAHLDFGMSVVQRVPAVDIVASRLPYTIMLAAGALVVAVGVGIPAGILMATRRGGLLENVLTAIVITGQSVPTFLSGILLIFLFAVTLRWLPASGVGGFPALIMPSIALGAVSMSTFARMTRIAVLDELGKDYVRAGRARGLSLSAVVVRHVLRNASIPVITIAALEIGNLLAGAVIIETVFAWPGIGQLAIQSIQSRDFLVVQVIVLLISFVYVLTSVLADFVYALVDPRIRLAR
ncbi:ABC transporter permease [Rhizobium johnstonii]|uniref:ABC transporter permease n=1 Tax=Rhizobium TaxID=379 RepID=UPI001031E359|nr:ABC transporter permease [Rhizobium leguminosarum]TBF70810.1 ABC transporter permease [Rhizobium leguminosarum]TBG93321.1 ABC transporter permease [Rhizobium leguminosarum]TBG98723.1 ABC transporter permease [Rhizobium leguminosarum]TBH29936.1 ABC transporter permease [Rhizobium leguminosarum]TBH50166.1 ABC transporter permease [Rhizobium leguminosarum]